MVHEIPPRSEVTTPPAVLPVPSTESDTREAETRAPRSSGSTLFLSEPQDESRAAIAAAVIAAANRTARLNVGERIVLEARVRHTYESHTLVSIATSPTRAAAHSSDARPERLRSYPPSSRLGRPQHSQHGFATDVLERQIDAVRGWIYGNTVCVGRSIHAHGCEHRTTLVEHGECS
jgi:hypothetical protein